MLILKSLIVLRGLYSSILDVIFNISVYLIFHHHSLNLSFKFLQGKLF